MKIWILTDGEPLPHFDESLRMMRSVYLADYLSQQGHQVSFWTSTWSHYKKKKYVLKDHHYNVNPNFQVRMLNTFGYKKNISLARILHYTGLGLKFWREAKKLPPPDIIISSMPSIELAYASVKYANSVGCPVLIDFRDMWPDMLLEIFPKAFRSLVRMGAHYQFVMMQSLCKGATGFIGISEPYLKWAANYAQRPVGKNDIVFPLSSPDFASFCSESAEEPLLFEQRKIILSDKFNVVFAGNYSKNTADLVPLIKAFKRLPSHYQLLIAGTAVGDSPLQTYYQGLVGEATNIHFLGWLDHKTLDYIYRHSSLAVAPYVNKTYFKMNLTNKPIEYLRYGLPILTSVKGYLSELLEQHESGLYYNDQEPEKLADMIKVLNENDDQRQSMSRNCRQLFDARFNYRQVVENFCQHLEQFI